MAKKQYAAGFRSELLGVIAGKIGETPVGILSLRLNPKVNFSSLTVMFDRPALERIIDDLTYLLENSKMLSKGNHQDSELKLAEIEAIHVKLTD